MIADISEKTASFFFAVPFDYIVILRQDNVIEASWRRTEPDHRGSGTFFFCSED